ncbi:MAG: hypothetical protein WD876_02140, partial [Candidatus Pacearchaeota archaeon]
NENNGKDNFKYMAGDNAAGEAKYIESQHITATTERVDFSRVGRQTSNPWENINQQAMFVNSPEARAESLAQERLFGVERFDSEKERKKDFRERDETKYDKYKPDLPKSR